MIALWRSALCFVLGVALILSAVWCSAVILGLGNGPGRDCPVLRDWRRGMGCVAAHRTRALARTQLSHYGRTKWDSLRPFQH